MYISWFHKFRYFRKPNQQRPRGNITKMTNDDGLTNNKFIGKFFHECLVQKLSRISTTQETYRLCLLYCLNLQNENRKTKKEKIEPTTTMMTAQSATAIVVISIAIWIVAMLIATATLINSITICNCGCFKTISKGLC